MKKMSLLKNKSRVAEVWFDEHVNDFYNAIGHPRGTLDFGNLTDRLRIKYRNQQRDFKWFLNKFKNELGSRGIIT